MSEIIREFKTAHFTVRMIALNDSDTVHWGAFDFDGGEEAREKVESGEWVLFTACAQVEHDVLGVIGEEFLGGCIYENIEKFEDHRECAAETRRLRAEHGGNVVCGSYFSDMIEVAIAQARATLEISKTIYVRGGA